MLSKGKDLGQNLLSQGKGLYNNEKTQEMLSQGKDTLSNLNKRVKDAGVYDKIQENGTKGLVFIKESGQQIYNVSYLCDGVE